MRTRLREILALSGVKIESDPEYMRYMEETQVSVKDWHKRNKSHDNYLMFKCKWLLKHHTKEDIVAAVEHLDSQREGNLIVDKEIILKTIDEVEKVYEYR